MRATFPLACPPHSPVYFYRSCVYMKKKSNTKTFASAVFAIRRSRLKNKAVPNLTLSLAFESLAAFSVKGPLDKRKTLIFPDFWENV